MNFSKGIYSLEFLLLPWKVICASESYARISQQGTCMKRDYLGLDSESDGTCSVFLQICCLDCNRLFLTIYRSFIT